MIALDIDGTLLRTGEPVPEVTVRAVRRVRAAGHHVVLASGRSLVGVLPVARQLGIVRGWVVASNGAVTARLTPEASVGYVLDQVLRFDVGSGGRSRTDGSARGAGRCRGNREWLLGEPPVPT
ncbi:HAD family hydrolase [Promicromonospora sp. NPDC060271]|uniref:HAD family hydrolase n=1 Tax=Promicromonospora sp. NPDC060271 TaxID=3347089 RepID=UPI0036515C84